MICYSPLICNQINLSITHSKATNNPTHLKPTQDSKLFFKRPLMSMPNRDSSLSTGGQLLLGNNNDYQQHTEHRRTQRPIQSPGFLVANILSAIIKLSFDIDRSFLFLDTGESTILCKICWQSSVTIFLYMYY